MKLATLGRDFYDICQYHIIFISRTVLFTGFINGLIHLLSKWIRLIYEIGNPFNVTNLINITIAPPVYFFHEIFSWKRMGRAYYTLGEISAHIHSSSFFDYWPHMVMIHPNFHLNFTKLCSSWYIEYAHVVCRRKIEWIF